MVRVAAQMRLTRSFSVLASLGGTLQRGVAATERFMSLALRPTSLLTVEPSKRLLDMRDVNGNIAFHNVCFSYPNQPDKAVLTNVNFEILRGQTVALVGLSGAGSNVISCGWWYCSSQFIVHM